MSQVLMVWLGVAAFALVANSLICADDSGLPDQAGTWYDDILQIIGFSACAGIPVWVNFVIGLFIIIPGLVLIMHLLGPLVSGAFANPIVGTIVAIASITSIVGLLLAIL